MSKEQGLAREFLIAAPALIFLVTGCVNETMFPHGIRPREVLPTIRAWVDLCTVVVAHVPGAVVLPTEGLLAELAWVTAMNTDEMGFITAEAMAYF